MYNPHRKEEFQQGGTMLQGVRFTLLQCRRIEDPMLQQEVDCFASKLNIPSEQIRSVNIIYEKPDIHLFETTDVFLVGGSGEYSVLDNEPFLEDFFHFLRLLCERGIPTFASCFGFQALVRALGGVVIHDVTNIEMGTVSIYLTDLGIDDLLFGSLPPVFKGQVGHKDRALRLPPAVLHLAYSDRCPYLALRVQGTPIYATQFHPELSMEENKERFLNYLHVYKKFLSEEYLKEVLENFSPTPMASNLMRRFVSEIVLPSMWGKQPEISISLEKESQN